MFLRMRGGIIPPRATALVLIGAILAPVVAEVAKPLFREVGKGLRWLGDAMVGDEPSEKKHATHGEVATATQESTSEETAQAAVADSEPTEESAHEATPEPKAVKKTASKKQNGEPKD